MITPSTATVVLSLAKGAIKLGHRLDVLLAEKAAVDGTFVLPMPKVAEMPSGVVQVREVRAFLAANPAPGRSDPLGDLRPRLVRTLQHTEPDADVVGRCFQRLFPQRCQAPAIEPDSLYLQELQKVLPALDVSDHDALAAAFHVAAGRDGRGLNYGMRVGLLVADVVAEFGAENTALFVREPRLRQIAQVVLERFAEPNLETFPAWSGLLRHALSATLNGLLDTRKEMGESDAWLAALLDALAEARAGVGGDEFVIGLLQGRGYPLLLSQGLARAAAELGADQANAFKQIAASVLATAAPLAQDRTFGAFFNEHWTDLLRGGLQALEKQVPTLLADQPDLVRDSLLALLRAVAANPQARSLSRDTLVRLTDAAVGAIAAKPALLGKVVGGKPWAEALLSSVVNTVARDGVRHALKADGIAAVVEDVATLVAAHPELIMDRPELVHEVVAPLLDAVQSLRRLDARALAHTAALGTLAAIAERHDKLDTRFAPVMIEFTTRVAGLVRTQTIRGVDASDLTQAAIATLLHNPRVFELKGNLVLAVLTALQAAAAADPRQLLSGPVFAAAAREVLATTARLARAKAEASLAQLTTELTQLIQSTLASAADQLGRGLDLPGLPTLLGGMVAAWARGELNRVDVADATFRAVVARLMVTA